MMRLAILDDYQKAALSMADKGKTRCPDFVQACEAIHRGLGLG
jgi:hypothetical protein